MCVPYIFAWCPQKPEEDARTRVTEGCDLLYGCWELDMGPLQEQQLLYLFRLLLEYFKWCQQTSLVERGTNYQA